MIHPARMWFYNTFKSKSKRETNIFSHDALVFKKIEHMCTKIISNETQLVYFVKNEAVNEKIFL